MKIEKKSEPKAKMKVVNGSAFAIETAPHLPKLHQACVVVAKRGGGKTTAVSNLLRMYKEKKVKQKNSQSNSKRRRTRRKVLKSN